MAAVCELRSPPIVEALVDLRCVVTGEQADFEALARGIASDYPRADFRRNARTELRVEGGRLLPLETEDLGFQGAWLTSASGNMIAQFRPDGFTLNNLNAYVGGEQLLAESMRLWTMFIERFRPASVARIALRYINQLHLPYRQGDEFDRFLTAAPISPRGAPQLVDEFLTRVVSQEPDIPATVIITQQLTSDEAHQPLVLLDIDAFQEGLFSIEPQDVRASLDRLRLLKNATFFAHLTDEALESYR